MSTIMNTPYTCLSCRVVFRDMDIQREHYKSDWHRYNLKRKVVELAPITSEEFNENIKAIKIAESNAIKQSGPFNCKSCKKTFNTRNQFENHLVSKKHKERSLKSSNTSSFVDLTEDVLMEEGIILNKKESNKENGDLDAMEVESDIESVDTDEWIEDTENPVKDNNCLFCNHHSRSWVRNLKHMTESHSFFIPDIEYCIDVKGLLIYLGEKIYGGYMCLWCNNKGRGFRSADASRDHMIDKGHCKMYHEGEALAEYEEFYDYSSSYPDAEMADPESEVEIPEIIPDAREYQLVLPSGTVVGHRSLLKYYKQNLNPKRPLALTKREKLHKVLGIYKQLGWTETKTEIVKKKIQDLKYMHKVQAKYSVDLQVKANKLQKHFRRQVDF